MPSSVNLGETLEGVVDRLVSKGRFGSRSEVLREGIRLVQERESWLEMVERKVEEGRAQVAAGKALDLDEAFDQLAARYAAK
jgi:antitoxin ParD1/3/4